MHCLISPQSCLHCDGKKTVQNVSVLAPSHLFSISIRNSPKLLYKACPSRLALSLSIISQCFLKEKSKNLRKMAESLTYTKTYAKGLSDQVEGVPINIQPVVWWDNSYEWQNYRISIVPQTSSMGCQSIRMPSDPHRRRWWSFPPVSTSHKLGDLGPQ